MQEQQHLTASNAARGEVHCPTLRFIDVISGKWAIPVLYRLIVAERPLRFRELQRALAPVTQKELTRQLKIFEHYGLVTRQVFAEVPPRVEYRITPLGSSVSEPICALTRWMKQHGDQLQKNSARRAG